MSEPLRIGLIGDRDETVLAHRAIDRSIVLAREAASLPIEADWIGTDTIHDESTVAGYHGLWCVPATPYRSMEGALMAIRFAREHRAPFLGTCGGFQHAVLEYARNALGWADAEHAETAPAAVRKVIAPLACSLVEVKGTVRFIGGSRLSRAYERPESIEGYHCRYGINPEFRDAIASGPLRVTAEDDEGDVRALELDGHPFFVLTLFQPERAALGERLSPIVTAFFEAAAEREAATGSR